MICGVKYHLIFILVTSLWGSNFILMKKATQSFGPMMVGAGRIAGGVLFLLTVVLLLRQQAGGWRLLVEPARLLKRWPMMVVVFLGFVFPFLIQPYLIHKHQDSAFFAMPIALVPLLTVLVSIPMLRVYPTWRQLAGVLGGLVCMGVLFGVGVERGVGWEDLLLVMSVPLGYAITNTTVKMKLSQVGAMPMGVVSMSVALMIVFPVSLAVDTAPTGPAADAAYSSSLLALAWLGLLGTGLSTWLFWKLIQVHGPLYASMVSYLVPVGALMWGWVDGEPMSLQQVGAFAGIIAMVVLVQWQPRGRSRVMPVVGVD